MRLSLPRRRVVACAVALSVCLTLTAFGMRTERMGLEFATGTAWLQSRAVGQVMLADGFSGGIAGSVAMDGVLSPESPQAAEPLVAWRGSASELRLIDARRGADRKGATLPAAPARVVGTTDGSYAFLSRDRPWFAPRADPGAARVVKGFSGSADDVVVDDWGVLWALSLAERRAVPFHGGEAEEAVRVGSVPGTVRLIVHKGEAALFVPSSGEIRGLRTGKKTELPAKGSGLLPVEHGSESIVGVVQPPRTLLLRDDESGKKTEQVELGDEKTAADRAFQQGTSVYVTDLSAGRLLVYDLVTGEEKDPIQIDDREILSAGFEMFVKDDMLWVNELDGPNALVVREDGHRLIRKYRESEEVRLPPGTASSNPATSKPSAPPSQIPSSAAETGRTTPSDTPSAPPPSTDADEEGKPREEETVAVPEPSPSINPHSRPISLDGPEGSLVLLYSPNGRTLAVAGANEIVLYDMPAKKPRGRIEGAGIVMAFSPDSRTLAAVSTDDAGKSVLRYDVLSLKRTGDPPLEASWPFGEVKTPIVFDTVSYVGAGKIIAGGGPYGNSRDVQRFVSWDLDEPGKYELLGWNDLRSIHEMSPDGSLVLSTSYGNATVKRMKYAEPDEVFEDTVATFDDALYAVWTGDGEAVVTVGAKITVHSLATGAAIRSIDYAPLEVDDRSVYNGVAANADGSVVALSGDDGSFTFWDTVTGKLRGEPITDFPAGAGLEFSPDGRSVAVTGGDGGIVWIVEVPDE